jgi:hypothetical protein
MDFFLNIIRVFVPLFVSPYFSRFNQWVFIPTRPVNCILVLVQVEARVVEVQEFIRLNNALAHHTVLETVPIHDIVGQFCWQVRFSL